MDEILDIVGLGHRRWGFARYKSISRLSTFLNDASTPVCERLFREYWNSEFKNDETLEVIEQSILKIKNIEMRNAIALHWNLYMTESIDGSDFHDLRDWMQKPVFQMLDDTHKSLFAYAHPLKQSVKTYAQDSENPMFLLIKYIYADTNWRIWIESVYEHARKPKQTYDKTLDATNLFDSNTL